MSAHTCDGLRVLVCLRMYGSTNGIYECMYMYAYLQCIHIHSLHKRLTYLYRLALLHRHQ